ncbi:MULTISPECIES: AlpA family transcriptional regulator [Microbacterium]|uniref:helix-turn-helix transcriptional regulator n=1 Tax=Microbacterium TaxID=33882 RepID=UPI0027D79EDB|nr:MULTISPECIES: XRE family transcriptional regulator [Microbacterium]
MTVEYLSLLDVARHLNVSRDTVAKYKLPEPDVRVGSGINAARGWSLATIDAWNAQRPGRGRWGARESKENAAKA